MVWATRRHLEVWTPPDAELGFRMQVPSQEARLPWWRAPLPAWAQAAAALVIFGVGLSVGLVRGPIATAGGFEPAAACSGDHDTDKHRLAQRTFAARRAVEIRDCADSCHGSRPAGRPRPPRRTKKSCRRLKRSWPRARSGNGVSSRSGPSKWHGTSKRSDVSIWRPFERQSGSSRV